MLETLVCKSETETKTLRLDEKFASAKILEVPLANLQSVCRPSSSSFTFQFQPVKIPSVLRELKSLKINKGAGLDNIPPRLLKAAADNNQFYNYFMDNNLLHSSQHGFRKKRSTQTALIKVVDEWLSNIDNGQVTAAIFFDLAKTFDTVKHSILVRKLQALGVTGLDLDWFI